MAKLILTPANDINVDGVSFKRSCNVLQKTLKDTYALDIRLAAVHDIVAVCMGFANYNEMRRIAEPHQPTTDNLHPEAYAWMKKSAEKSAEWVIPVSPKKLLEKRTLHWIATAIDVTNRIRMWNMPSMTMPKITLVIGQDSSLVLQAISRVYKEPKYFSIKHGDTLDGVYDDVKGQIAQHQKVIDAHIAEHGRKRFIGGVRGRAKAGYQCIAGLAENPIDTDVMHQLTRISELDPGMLLAININRADLLKFTAPDLDGPHFHYLTIVDLDKIKSDPFSSRQDGFAGFEQSTYTVWVNPKTRHETLIPHLEYRPQQNAS